MQQGNCFLFTYAQPTPKSVAQMHTICSRDSVLPNIINSRNAFTGMTASFDI